MLRPIDDQILARLFRTLNAHGVRYARLLDVARLRERFGLGGK
jgi:hypothetical protein